MDNLNVPVLFPDEAWQQCFEHFLQDQYRRSQSHATVVSYTGVLRRFFAQNNNPENVARANVSTFLQQPCVSNGKQGKPAAIATINARASIIRSFYQFASSFTIDQDEHLVPLYQRANPCNGIQYGQPARAYKTLSLQEVKTFFSVMDPETVFGARDRAIFWTYLLTCRRRSELCALRWRDIEYGTITDEDGSTREAFLFSFRGKGHQGILDRQELPQKAYEEIQHYLQVTGRWETMKPEDPVFAALANQHGPSNVRPGELRPLSAKGIVNRLKIYARAAGIDEKKFSLHSLRHTGAFLRKISGEDLFSISHTLRHRSLDMTKRYLEGLTTNADKGSRLVEAKLAALGVM